MNKLLLFLICIGFLKVNAQQEDAWIFLKDKPNQTTYLENPLTMLTQRALDRRAKLGISLDEKDVPIYTDYYNLLTSNTSITILAKSKWLNAIHIQGEVEVINSLRTTYNFIDYIEFANKSLNTSAKTSSNAKKITPNHYNKLHDVYEDFDYGAADNQIKMLKGGYLHQQGLTGKNQIIAVLDAGFPNVNTLAAFSRIRDNNQILGGYNFADRNENFYSRSSHGTHVLSTIAGYVEDEFVGTAPDASFYLFITEISETETILEESLWVEAAERADSLGVDVMNTSLGYTTYDNGNHSHTYQDMDGKTTFISRGAEIAASRGILLVNSVGNSGNDSWKYLGAPADANSVISVGAVNSNGEIASFSSYGPTSDYRIKPEILAQGSSSSIINYFSGQTSASSGTSFSSPIMAGLIACLNDNDGFILKSANTTTENFNTYLKDAVFQSADKYNNPTDQHGYGIPNFEVALNTYISSLSSIENNFKNLRVYPNPVFDTFTISSQDYSNLTIKIHSVLGEKIVEKTNLISNIVDISSLKSGVYILTIKDDHQYKNIKLIKK